MIETTHHNQYIGHEAEQLVSRELEKCGWSVSFDNNFYDLRATKGDETILIEVKCASFVVKNGGGVTRYGRFDFTNKKNTQAQRRENVYICFVVHVGDNFEILGLIKARTLKVKRYVNLSDVMTKNRLKNLKTLF